MKAHAQAKAEQHDALADVARQTADPTVYALALQGCGRGGAPARSASCSLLGAAQMARLDPENAMP